MRILVFTTLFPNSKMPNHGIFVKTRVSHLAKSCDIRVVAPVPWHKAGGIPKEEMIDGLKVYHPRYFMTPKIFRSLYGLFIFSSVFAYVKRLKKEFDFDLIDAHFVYPDGMAAVLLGKFLGKKATVTARGTDINLYPKFRMLRSLIKYTLTNAAHIISVSSYLKEIMLGLGIGEERISVIPNGVDLTKFFPIPKAEARTSLALPHDRKIILSLGLLIERKGFHYLIEAFNMLDDKKALLYIIGEGEWRGKLKNLVGRLNLEGRVIFLGEKPQAELYKWYSSADLFCLTSLREGRPNVVLESLACGTPVVSMDRWGLSEVVNTDSGILVDSYEPQAIAQKIGAALQRRWDSGKITAAVKHLDWESTSGKIAKLFNDTMKKQDIIFFSSDDWNSGLKTSKYHLATRLARDNRVFFINSIGLRTPSISRHDAKKVIAKLSGFFGGIKKVVDNLFIYTPIAIPFQKIGFVRSINNLLIALQVRMIMARYGVRNPVVWTFLPNSLGVLRMLPRKALIYYSVDDMSAFKGVPSDIISKLDEALTKESDVVFAASKELFEKKRLLNKNTFYSPHGVDFELFNKAVTEEPGKRPVDISNIPKPIIGFYGLISADWIDYGLVRFLSERRPGWSFVFLGKVDRLKENPPEANNIYYLPVKPYEELYKYSRSFDVAMLPFNINQLTMHSHPLKILEYLSAGKPVVSIKIPEVLNYENVIKIALSYDDFLVKLEDCLKNDNKAVADNRIKFAALHSWEKRFDEIQDTIDSHI